MPIKVVYNAMHGGYGFSQKAMERLAQLGLEEEVEKDFAYKAKWPLAGYSLDGVPRHDPRLVQVVEEFGREACSAFADLQIHLVEGDRYRIHEYDGLEEVQEPEDISWIVVES